MFAFSTASHAQVKNTVASEYVPKAVKFYPNPATSAINFELQRGYDKSFTLQLFNFMGRKVLEITPNAQRISVPLDGFFRGVYIYQLRDKLGKIIDSGRFQVVK